MAYIRKVASINNLIFNIRSYRITDRPAVRTIYDTDEFAHPQFMSKYPRRSEYQVDEASNYYTDFELESLLVAEDGKTPSLSIELIN